MVPSPRIVINLSPPLWSVSSTNTNEYCGRPAKAERNANEARVYRVCSESGGQHLTPTCSIRRPSLFWEVT